MEEAGFRVRTVGWGQERWECAKWVDLSASPVPSGAESSCLSS